MREILFRGKKSENGEWVNGEQLTDGITGQCFIKCVGDSVNESDKVNEKGCLRFFAFEVDPETVCQCTGVPDKNRKLIFERDVVRRERFGEFIIGEVVWLDIGFCGFYLKCGNSFFPMDKDEDIGISRSDEVIGNIFDNHDLINGGRNDD